MTAENGHVADRVYRDQSGDIHLNGGKIFDASENDATAAVGSLATKAASVSIAASVGATNVCLVTIQVLDSNGNAISTKEVLDVWLSDAATGAVLTSTTASGAVAAGAAGTDLLVRTSKKETLVQTDATGKYILSITDSAKTGFYVAVLLGTQLTVSSQLQSSDFG